MVCLLALALTIAVTMGIALAASTVERSSGNFGDSSFVPSILLFGLGVVVIELIIGFGSGNIGVWIK